jgi:hypothetical protein
MAEEAAALVAGAVGDPDLDVSAQARFSLDRLSGVEPTGNTETEEARSHARLVEELDEYEEMLGSSAAVTRLRAVKALANLIERVASERASGLLAAARGDRDLVVATQAEASERRIRGELARFPRRESPAASPRDLEEVKEYLAMLRSKEGGSALLGAKALANLVDRSSARAEILAALEEATTAKSPEIAATARRALAERVRREAEAR